MVDRLIKRGNFDDKTEAIEKRCATFQVKKSYAAEDIIFLWKSLLSGRQLSINCKAEDLSSILF